MTARLRQGDTIHQAHETDGTDCDGRMSTRWDGEVRIDRLDESRCDGWNYPDWTETESGQRDYSAEAMGY